jgi:hypothetical protein
LLEEEFEDTKGVIRICKSKDRQTQWPKEKVQKDNDFGIDWCSVYAGFI